MKFSNIIVLLVLIIAGFNAAAQRKSTEKADKAFNAGRYYEAVDLYKYAYGKAKDKVEKAEITYMVAESYRMINNYKNAESWYGKAINKNYPGPMAYLYWADALKAQGKYAEAKEKYKQYNELVPDDKNGKIGEESCTFAIEWMENPTRYTVENMDFFNSKEADFCPAYGKDDYKIVLFTSSREGSTGGKISDVTGQYYTDIFKSSVDRKGKWSEPTALGEGVNTAFDEGTPSTNPKCNMMYFTSFREDEKGNLICKIFSSKKEGIEWTNSKPLELDKDSVTVGQPAISPDELTLIFVASSKGSIGGKDLWKVTRTSAGGEWGKPVNMGSQINTEGDEMFPYIHEDNTLYFASNGHLGMGGLDIFKAVEKENGQWQVENMKYPINSPADDFGIIFEKTSERGYFSSNREGGKGDDDIYQFALPPIEFKLAGTVRNQKSEDAVADADVVLIGSDGTNVSKKTEADGTFSFSLAPNTDYRIISRRKGFLNSKGKETTKGITSSKEFRMDIFMSPDNTRIELPGIMYDFGKWDLRPESLVALEKLVEILNDNPNITIEIGSHTDFRGSDAANQELSGKRAQSVVDFLVTYGIDRERLSSKGYGEAMPQTLDKATAKKYDFLKEGDVLTESFINRLSSEEQKEICHQINRRTDFGLTGRDFVPKIKRRK